MLDKYKVLIRKNTILSGGLNEVSGDFNSNTDKIISFDNIKILSGGKDGIVLMDRDLIYGEIGNKQNKLSAEQTSAINHAITNKQVLDSIIKKFNDNDKELGGIQIKETIGDVPTDKIGKVYYIKTPEQGEQGGYFVYVNGIDKNNWLKFKNDKDLEKHFVKTNLQNVDMSSLFQKLGKGGNTGSVDVGQGVGLQLESLIKFQGVLNSAAHTDDQWSNFITGLDEGSWYIDESDGSVNVKTNSGWKTTGSGTVSGDQPLTETVLISILNAILPGYQLKNSLKTDLAEQIKNGELDSGDTFNWKVLGGLKFTDVYKTKIDNIGTNIQDLNSIKQEITDLENNKVSKSSDSTQGEINVDKVNSLVANLEGVTKDKLLINGDRARLNYIGDKQSGSLSSDLSKIDSKIAAITSTSSLEHYYDKDEINSQVKDLNSKISGNTAIANFKADIDLGNLALNVADGLYPITKNGKLEFVATTTGSGGSLDEVDDWNAFSTAMSQIANHGKLYLIKDVDGQDGLGMNEPAIGYIIDDTNYKLFRTWEETKLYLNNALTLKANVADVEIDDADLNGLNSIHTLTGTGGGNLPVLSDVEFVSTWTEFNTAMGDSNNHGKLYFIEDVDGAEGLGDNESAFGYIENGTTYKLLRTWDEAKTYIDGEVTKKADLADAQSNAWAKLTSVQKRTFTATPGTPAPTADGITSWGDLEDDTIRADFMSKAVVDDWYTVLLGSKPAIINIKSGDKTTNFLFTGQSINSGAAGETIEAIQGNITSVNVSHRTATYTGDFYSSSLNIPEGYAPTQYLPKATVEHMISNATSTQFNNTLIISGNQVERKNASDDSTTEWRHGNSIASTLLSTGHPIIEHSTIEYIDDYNNVIHVIYSENKTYKATLVYPEGIVNCDINVVKITDWDNAWDGTGVPTGTDAGWKITFSNPVDANGATTTFHHASTPIRMKLVGVNDDTTVVDMPTDFFENFDNVIGKSIDVDELWLQYNTTDSLGNTFTNYGPHAPAKFNVFTLPAGRTIYDIEMIRTYSNNKTKWYAEYNGRYMPDRLKYLTKANVDIFGDNCKIDVKINRVDDMGASWAEFNGWEIRPVIENGVLVPGKVHGTNKGIYTASDGGNFRLLGTGNDVHYMVFKFKGGI